MAIKGCSVRFVTQTHLSFPGQGNTFISGNLCHLYALLLWQRALLVSAVVSQLPSAQNHQYANLACSGEAYADRLHTLNTAGSATIILG